VSRIQKILDRLKQEWPRDTNGSWREFLGEASLLQERIKSALPNVVAAAQQVIDNWNSQGGSDAGLTPAIVSVVSEKLTEMLNMKVKQPNGSCVVSDGKETFGVQVLPQAYLTGTGPAAHKILGVQLRVTDVSVWPIASK